MGVWGIKSQEASSELQQNSNAQGIRQKFTDDIRQSGQQRAEEIDSAKKQQLKSLLEANVSEAKMNAASVAMGIASFGAVKTMVGLFDNEDKRNAVRDVETQMIDKLKGGDRDTLMNALKNDPMVSDPKTGNTIKFSDAVNAKVQEMKADPKFKDLDPETQKYKASRELMIANPNMRDQVAFGALAKEVVGAVTPQGSPPKFAGGEAAQQMYNNKVEELYNQGVAKWKADHPNQVPADKDLEKIRNDAKQKAPEEVATYIMSRDGIDDRIKLYQSINATSTQPVDQKTGVRQDHGTLLNQLATDALVHRDEAANSPTRHSEIFKKLQDDLNAVAQAWAKIAEERAQMQKNLAQAAASGYSAASLQG